MNVSVIIPLYNGERFIKRAVVSVFNQTRRPIELIIVDDASIDGSLVEAEKICVNAPIPIKILRSPQNSGGPAAPLNQGVREACGDLLAVLDQDDYFLPDKLKKSIEVFEGQPDVHLVFSDFMGPSRFSCPVIVEGRVWLHSQLANQARPRDILKLESGDGIYGLLRYINVCPSFSGMVFLNKDYQVKGGFDETLKIAADYDFICWVALRYSIAYIERALFYKEVHEDNLSRHPIRHFENSVVFLKYLWQAQAQGIRVCDTDFQKKALNRWGIYAEHCRKINNYKAPLALNVHALRYFGFNFLGLKAMVRLYFDRTMRSILG